MTISIPDNNITMSRILEKIFGYCAHLWWNLQNALTCQYFTTKRSIGVTEDSRAAAIFGDLRYLFSWRVFDPQLVYIVPYGAIQYVRKLRVLA